jgi:hypothetical protein
MTERELLEALAEALELTGWTWMHIIRSDGVTQGDRGFPDLIAGKQGVDWMLAWELKSATGQPTADQLGWQLALRHSGIDVRIVRPVDYDRALEVIVRGRDPREVWTDGNAI